jgi:hypothetical protein
VLEALRRLDSCPPLDSCPLPQLLRCHFWDGKVRDRCPFLLGVNERYGQLSIPTTIDGSFLRMMSQERSGQVHSSWEPKRCGQLSTPPIIEESFLGMMGRKDRDRCPFLLGVNERYGQLSIPTTIDGSFLRMMS